MRGLIRRFPSIKSIKNKYRAIGYRKQKDNEIFLLFDLNNTEILIPNKKEFQNDESDISPLTTGNKKSILAYPAKWAEGFGEDNYQSIKQNTLSSDGEWNSQATGTPYETTELNVSTPEEVRKQLDEILNEINLKGGTHG